LKIYNNTVLSVVEFTGHLLCDQDTTIAIREWERKGVGITNGNGNKNRLNLGSGMGMGMNHWNGRK